MNGSIRSEVPQNLTGRLAFVGLKGHNVMGHLAWQCRDKGLLVFGAAPQVLLAGENCVGLWNPPAGSNFPSGAGFALL